MSTSAGSFDPKDIAADDLDFGLGGNRDVFAFTNEGVAARLAGLASLESVRRPRSPIG